MYLLLFNFQCTEFFLLSYWSLQALAAAALTTISGVALPCFSVPHTLLVCLSALVELILSWCFFFGPCLFSLLDLLKSFPNFLHWKINFSSLLCINMEGHYYLVWVILLAVYFHYLSILITFKIFCYCFSSMNYLSFKI